MANGIFEARALYADVNQAVYVNNNDGPAVVTINLCNQNHVSTATSIALSTSATSPTADEWIEYGAELQGKGVLERTGLILGAQQYVVVSSSRANVSAVSWGIESGTVTTALTISQNPAPPTWTTASGTIATIYDNATGTHVTIAAVDPELTSVTYSIVSGSLPAGTTLNASTGVISGNPNDVVSQTTSTFTAAAADAGGNQRTRSFSIIVNPAPDGSTSAKASGSPAQIASTLGTTPTNGVYWYKNTGYNSNTPFQAYTDWSVNGNTGYMILTQSQISGAAITNYVDVGTGSTSVSGTRGHNNTFREPTFNILGNWSGDTSNRCLVGQYRTSTGTTLATGTNLQWIQIAVTPATFRNMFDNIPGPGEFTGTISARSAGGTGNFYWSKNNSEYPNHNQMGNALTDNGWNGNNYIEIRQAGGDGNHSYFVAGDGGGSYWAASLGYNGGSGERVGFFGFAPNNVI
jgi:hypothetical protein